jgi:branched-chain amino acid transport system substrate-binding protein
MIDRIALAAVAFAGISGCVADAARAQEIYKIGSSVGLSGYAATADRAWKDGLELAADYLNGKGGLIGRKVQLIAEDNRSEPQDAVVGYRKMMSNDDVQIFDSGCVSAGNFAAASSVARAEIPMMLCSILPPRPEEQKWAFSVLPPPRFEIESRFRYLKEKTAIRKIGILYDPTPYALLMKNIAGKMAADFGLEIVATDTYKQDDADLSVQIGHINAAGAGAIVKIGQGGSTVTAAKNIKQLGLDSMLLLASLDDGGIFMQAGAVLGDRFFFVAPGVQVPDVVPTGPARDAMDEFLTRWRAKFAERDPNAGARAWDSMMLIAKAVEAAKSVGGPAVRDAIEHLPPYQGAFTAFVFSPDQHVGIIKNPYVVARVDNAKFVAVE